MSDSLVSIIIPVYKAEPYLRQCLDSIIHQTYTDLEIICVNDESPDKSLDILKEYAAADNRLVLIDKKNEGVSAARNLALRVAKGKYIAFVDADDWIEPETFSVTMKEMNQSDSDVVIWPYISEHENKKTEKQFFNGTKTFDTNETQRLLHRRFVGLLGSELAHPELADSLCTVWGKLYRADLLTGIVFVDLNEIGTYEDGLFNMEAFGRVRKAVYIDRPFYHYRRVNNSSQTAAYRNSLFCQWQRLISRIENYINNYSFSPQYREALNNRVALSII